MRVLDVGCGHTKVPGAIGVDLHPDRDVQVVADAVLLPFADGTFDRVYARHLLEHFCFPQDEVMPELARVLKPGGELWVVLPHYTAPGVLAGAYHFFAPALLTLRQWAVQDPETGWRRWFDYGDPSGGYLPPRRWKVVSRRLVYHRLWRRLGLEWLANIYPELWEAFLVHLFPCREIHAVLRPL